MSKMSPARRANIMRRLKYAKPREDQAALMNRAAIHIENFTAFVCDELHQGVDQDEILGDLEMLRMKVNRGIIHEGVSR